MPIFGGAYFHLTPAHLMLNVRGNLAGKFKLTANRAVGPEAVLSGPLSCGEESCPGTHIYTHHFE